MTQLEIIWRGPIAVLLLPLLLFWNKSQQGQSIGSQALNGEPFPQAAGEELGATQDQIIWAEKCLSLTGECSDCQHKVDIL